MASIIHRMNDADADAALAAHLEAWHAECVQAATSPWRIRLAELLVDRVASFSARDLLATTAASHASDTPGR